MTSLGSFQFQLFSAPGFSVLSIRSLWTQSWKDIRSYLVHIPYFTEEKPEAWRRSGISLPDITQFSRGPACVLVKLGDTLLQGLKAQERKHGSQLMATPPTHTLRLASTFTPVPGSHALIGGALCSGFGRVAMGSSFRFPVSVQLRKLIVEFSGSI